MVRLRVTASAASDGTHDTVVIVGGRKVERGGRARQSGAQPSAVEDRQMDRRTRRGGCRIGGEQIAQPDGLETGQRGQVDSGQRTPWRANSCPLLAASIRARARRRCPGAATAGRRARWRGWAKRRRRPASSARWSRDSRGRDRPAPPGHCGTARLASRPGPMPPAPERAASARRMRRSGWPVGAGSAPEPAPASGCGSRSSGARSRPVARARGQFDIGLRDRPGKASRAAVTSSAAARVEARAASIAAACRPNRSIVQFRLACACPATGSSRIGRRDDILARQPIILFLGVERYRRAVIGAAGGQYRLGLPQPGQRDVERRVARQRVADDPVELRIARPRHQSAATSGACAVPRPSFSGAVGVMAGCACGTNSPRAATRSDMRKLHATVSSLLRSEANRRRSVRILLRRPVGSHSFHWANTFALQRSENGMARFGQRQADDPAILGAAGSARSGHAPPAYRRCGSWRRVVAHRWRASSAAVPPTPYCSPSARSTGRG